MRDHGIAPTLLDWYDRHARDLPWRIGPQDRRAGHLPDPYHVWLSEIMLQQTTVAAVRDYFAAFVRRWPGVADLAAAPDADVMGAWAGLGYYARARNLLRCARIVAGERGGRFPETAAELERLPGIGRYTAAAVAAIAFDESVPVMDGNVERVMARLHGVDVPLPAAKPELYRMTAAATPAARPGDYAQAVMDLGATICTPRSPACGLCPLSGRCIARRDGTAAGLPRKAPKAAKPVRGGIAWIARREDGAWLVERRPERGLLGGMLGWPTTDWSGGDGAGPPLTADWQQTGLEVRHTFTHFHLRLDLHVARVESGARPDRGAFVAPDAFRPSDLPTVMRKAFDLVRPILARDGAAG